MADAYGQGQTEFSGDVDLLGRINQIQMALSMAIIQNDTNLRLTALKSFYFLIVTEMKDDKEKAAIYNSIQDAQTKLYSYQARKNNPRLKGRNIKIPEDLVTDLDKIHITLETIYDKSGLKKKIKSDGRKAFG